MAVKKLAEETLTANASNSMNILAEDKGSINRYPIQKVANVLQDILPKPEVPNNVSTKFNNLIQNKEWVIGVMSKPIEGEIVFENFQNSEGLYDKWSITSNNFEGNLSLSRIRQNSRNFIVGHKYFFQFESNLTGISYNEFYIKNSLDGFQDKKFYVEGKRDIHYYEFICGKETNSANVLDFSIIIPPNAIVSIENIKLFDLTETFGVGNEPDSYLINKMLQDGNDEFTFNEISKIIYTPKELFITDKRYPNLLEALSFVPECYRRQYQRIVFELEENKIFKLQYNYKDSQGWLNLNNWFEIEHYTDSNTSFYGIDAPNLLVPSWNCVQIDYNLENNDWALELLIDRIDSPTVTMFNIIDFDLNFSIRYRNGAFEAKTPKGYIFSVKNSLLDKELNYIVLSKKNKTYNLYINGVIRSSQTVDGAFVSATRGLHVSKQTNVKLRMIRMRSIFDETKIKDSYLDTNPIVVSIPFDEIILEILAKNIHKEYWVDERKKHCSENIFITENDNVVPFQNILYGETDPEKIPEFIFQKYLNTQTKTWFFSKGYGSLEDWCSYQEKLVSGVNIKTINGSSIIGNGNLKIEGTGGEGSSSEHTIVSVKDFGALGDGITDDTDAIRLARDEAYNNHKPLYFPSGTYMIHGTIQIYSEMEVYGTRGSVIKKITSVTQKIAQNALLGATEVFVQDASKFTVGYDVYIGKIGQSNYGDTCGVITAIDTSANKITFDVYPRTSADPHSGLCRNVNASDGYVSQSFAPISTFKAVDAGGNIYIHNLEIDSNVQEDEPHSYILSAIHIDPNKMSVTIRDIRVKNCNADGISLQNAGRTVVDNCEVLDTPGHGIHPGYTTEAVLINNCKIYNAAGCGIYDCYSVSGLSISNCFIKDCRSAVGGLDEYSKGSNICNNTFVNCIIAIPSSAITNGCEIIGNSFFDCKSCIENPSNSIIANNNFTLCEKIIKSSSQENILFNSNNVKDASVIFEFALNSSGKKNNSITVIGNQFVNSGGINLENVENSIFANNILHGISSSISNKSDTVTVKDNIQY